MKPLTAWNDPAAEAHVRGQLQRVVAAVVPLMGGTLEALVLAGGFGRGEGSVERLPDGRWHVINDYDLEVVYREPWGRLPSKLVTQLRFRRRLTALAEALADELAVKQVDLSLRPAGSLSARGTRLADYDLQHGHELLWGAADPVRRMPPMAPSDIPAFEGTWLLRNRGIGLLLARLYLDRGTLHAENRENFYIEINKALLAMGDALHILAGRYTVSYADRAAGIEALSSFGFPAHAELVAGYRRAAEYKLRPVRDMHPGVAPDALWQAVASLYGRYFLWHEGRRIGRPFATLADYARWVDAQPRAGGGGALRRWFDRRLGTVGDCPAALVPLKHDKLRSILFVAALVDARAGGPHADAVLRAAAPADGAPLPWRALARGFLALIHPGGEVGRFLAADAGGPR